MKFNISKRQRLSGKPAPKNAKFGKEANNHNQNGGSTQATQSKKMDRRDKIPEFFNKYRKVVSGSKGVRLPEP